jgi:hypothetical protein
LPDGVGVAFRGEADLEVCAHGDERYDLRTPNAIGVGHLSI